MLKHARSVSRQMRRLERQKMWLVQNARASQKLPGSLSSLQKKCLHNTMIDSYARLLESVVETGDAVAAEAAVTKLVAHLRSAGRMNMLSKIAHELRRVSARRQPIAPRVEVAQKKEEAAALRAAADFGIKASNVDVNPS